MKRSVTTTVAGALAAGVLAVTALPADAASLGSSEVVANWYQDFLGRNLAAARNDPGHLTWADRLDAGDPRGQVLGDIVKTPEYANSSVDALYAVLLFREPDSGAQVWRDNIPRGMAVEWVEQNILASGEFRGGGSSSLYVENLYSAILGRQPAPGESRYWSGRLQAVGALGTVREIWYTDEAADLRTSTKYQALLGRAPNGGEVAYWRGSEKQSDIATSIAIASTNEYFPITPAAADAQAKADGATTAQATAQH